MGRGDWQGADGFKQGNLKRQLETIPLFPLNAAFASPSGEGTNFITKRIWLRGLQGNLKLLIACGVSDPDNHSSTPYPYPATPGTMQLYPTTKFGDASKILLRPVFQDPTNVLNVNAPLPQQIPFGWEGSFTETDEVMIEVIVNTFAWLGTNLTGTICVQVTVEYNGAWWDVDAFQYALGNVQLTGDEATIIGTLSGGG